jgi:hypothetical protein
LKDEKVRYQPFMIIVGQYFLKSTNWPAKFRHFRKLERAVKILSTAQEKMSFWIVYVRDYVGVVQPCEGVVGMEGRLL